MKVLLTVASVGAAYGGPARSVAGLADALARQGAEVGVWAPDGSAPSCAFVSASSSVQRLAGTLRGALDRFGRPDVIHDNGLWLPYNHRIARAAYARAIPRLVSTRGMLMPWAWRHKRLKKRVAWHLYQRRDLASAQGIHATSEDEAAHLARFGVAVPVHVIPNGVPLPPIEPQGRRRMDGSAERTALFVGRLHPVKGLPMLLNAWARVRPARWTLLLVGPDEAGHRDRLERLVERHGLGRQVAFGGERKGAELEATYRAADLFVLPSHTENFGMAVAEAMSYGLPVLTTRGTPWEDLDRYGCGWWVASRDEAIEAALREATAEATEALEARGRRARELVRERYSWDRVAAAFLSVLRSLAGRHSKLRT